MEHKNQAVNKEKGGYETKPSYLIDEAEDEWVIVPEGMQSGGTHRPQKKCPGGDMHFDMSLGWGERKREVISIDWKHKCIHQGGQKTELPAKANGPEVREPDEKKKGA